MTPVIYGFVIQFYDDVNKILTTIRGV